jgi:hypothetical protein
MIQSSDLQAMMVEKRAILLAGGPNNAMAHNRLAKEATAFIKDRQRAALLAEQLAVGDQLPSYAGRHEQ